MTVGIGEIVGLEEVVGTSNFEVAVLNASAS
jgi:hypothetical protein